MQFWLKLDDKTEEKLINEAKRQDKTISKIIEEHFLNSFNGLFSANLNFEKDNAEKSLFAVFLSGYKPDDTVVGLPCSEIYADYLEWCAENNTSPYSPKAFGRRCGKNVLGISYSRANVRYRRCVRTI
jgi:hypothetical protein